MADYSRNITGAEAVIQVMESMGLGAPSSVADSQNPTAKQMWRLASDLGMQLLDEGDEGWQFLNREFVITTSGAASYPLPEDFNEFVSDSQWNRTTRLPAIGSLREYEWQMLKARQLAGSTFTMLFRIENEQVTFYETSSDPQEIVLPYVGRGWVRTALGAYRDNLTMNDDVILYDSQMFKAGLKLAWLAEKKFDTTRQQAVFDDLLKKATSKDVPGRTLTLDRRSGGYPYLGAINVPSTGYGGG